MQENEQATAPRTPAQGGMSGAQTAHHSIMWTGVPACQEPRGWAGRRTWLRVDTSPWPQTPDPGSGGPACKLQFLYLYPLPGWSVTRALEDGAQNDTCPGPFTACSPLGLVFLSFVWVFLSGPQMGLSLLQKPGLLLLRWGAPWGRAVSTLPTLPFPRLPGPWGQGTGLGEAEGSRS